MSAMLQRPGAPLRSKSASSFAEGFSNARNKVNKDIKKLGELDEKPSPGSEVPGLTESGDSTPSAATPLTRPVSPISDQIVADDFAYAFDIDGVLVRGGDPIPEAIEAMKVLNGENEYGIRVYVSIRRRLPKNPKH